MTPEERAQWLYETINSEISLPQWQVWANQVDARCPPNKPFRSTKQVSGGDQNECVETPDNCPEGTTAFGQNQCISVQDPRIQSAWGTGPAGAPGAGGAGAAGAAPQAPQLSMMDLLSNMTFQRMFGHLNPMGARQVGQENRFNFGQGNQGRVLDGGALQWVGPSPFATQPQAPAAPAGGALPPGLPATPSMVAANRAPQPMAPQGGMFGIVNGINRRRRGVAPGAPATATFAY
jgi:hypothetical protein